MFTGLRFGSAFGGLCRQGKWIVAQYFSAGLTKRMSGESRQGRKILRLEKLHVPNFFRPYGTF